MCKEIHLKRSSNPSNLHFYHDCSGAWSGHSTAACYFPFQMFRRWLVQLLELWKATAQQLRAPILSFTGAVRKVNCVLAFLLLLSVAMGLLWRVTMAMRLPWLQGGCELVLREREMREDLGSSLDRLTCSSEVLFGRRGKGGLEEAQRLRAAPSAETASIHLVWNNVWEIRARASVRVTSRGAGVNSVCSQVSSSESVRMNCAHVHVFHI